MAETKVKNSYIWDVLWAILIVAAVFAGVRKLQPPKPDFSWRIVCMDGHRSGMQNVTADNVAEALGTFTDDGYVSPAGVVYPVDSPMAHVAAEVMEVQPKLAALKKVVGHCARMMMNDRDNPDLPLGNLVADVLRESGSAYFKVPMDFAVINFGGIRVPMPEGAVTLDDITSMFPFKNYMCYAKMKGADLAKLLDVLAGQAAFQAISGAKVLVKAHKVESATVGGEPIDPERIYNVTTIDFLLDGGDGIKIGALSQDVVLSHVLIKDVMLSYISALEAKGEVIDSAADGRVVMED
ncbi:MAG: 5'-nucleotidase C-terminal domain-containing protein [Bacteroidales bacterium]|nr:5'-nucleotidase C-terminal domain-containing protein [Bacteroidales bacterium]